MRLIPYKIKLILLSIVPSIVAVTIIVIIITNQIQSLTQAQKNTFEEEVLSLKKTELKNYGELAYTVIKDTYLNDKLDKQVAQKIVIDILKKMSFGDDGYFYIYSYSGLTVSHPKLPHLEGRNLYNFQDNNGNFLIQQLIQTAKDGGGYTRYIWNKPSSNKYTEKIGYTIGLDKWEWMVGTGLYIDDIQLGVNKISIKSKNILEKTLLFALLIISGVIIVVSIIGYMVNVYESRLANTKIKSIIKKTLIFQEDERKRVSRELHDGINQLLVSVKYKLESALSKLMKNQNDMVKVSINEASDILSLSITEIRKISKDLRPTLLDDFGLFTAIDNLSSEFSKNSNIKVNFDKNITFEQIPPHSEIAIYRIIQESFTNITKHAKDATLVHLSLTIEKSNLVLKISNNGTGFNSEKALHKTNPARGMGIKNMQDRVHLLDGKITILSSIKKGTTITVELPIKNIRK